MDSLHGTDSDNEVPEYDAFDNDDEITHLHGAWLYRIIGKGAPDSTVHTFRIIDEEGEFSKFDLLNAFQELTLSDVEVVNLSLGELNPNCMGNCLICRTAEQVADTGKHVIVAVGDSNSEYRCPAKSDRVISVGGFQDLCRFEPSFAPKAIWVRKPDPGPDEESYSEVYCGFQGCSDRMRCRRNRQRQVWMDNPPFDRQSPNVLAPVHLPDEDANGYVGINDGSSFSAGYITGSLASLFAEIPDDALPRPMELISHLESIPNNGYIAPCFNAPELREKIEQHL